MSFVWFDHRSANSAAAKEFYAAVCGWQLAEAAPGMTMIGEAARPWGSISQIASEAPDVSGWVPFIQVTDLDASTTQATRGGAAVLQGKTQGPMGFFCVVRDPAGAVVALWQQG